MTKSASKSVVFGLVACAVGVVALLSATSAEARSFAASANVPSTMGSSYQDADGNYRSYSDFVRDLNGTPCGIACSQHLETR